MSFFLIIKSDLKYTLISSVQQLHKTLRCLSTCENVTKKAEEKAKPTIKAAYQPLEVESKWYELWESRNYFKPSKSEKDSFLILLPPPNVTGNLHLGHALTCSVQDVILRWKRMKGESVLWVPGVDHAGIATQAAVEKYIKENHGLSRQELGREEFLKTTWKWKNEKAKRIIEQLRKMGASLDWSKLIFTLDSSHSELVAQSFIQLYNDGLIYRKESLVNWSCALKSSISDIEVDWIMIKEKEKVKVPGYDKPVGFGYLHDIAYKVCDGDDEIIVSTTRPETLLGDVAIAIHPDDLSLSKFQNKYVWHPFRNERMPIIVDEMVHLKFGTGAVKITPSHSLIDFQIGEKHKLKFISVIDEEGLIQSVGTKFHGLKRFDARWAVINDLKNLNLYRGSKPHSMKLPVCSRSGDVVEYLLKEQWFLKCDSLAKKAIDAVRNGDLKIIPESNNIWYNWLDSKQIRDWNLSRQSWWGHRIPMYECQYKNKSIWVAGSSLDEAKSKAADSFGVAYDEIKISQDPDVLDTWFSSGLLSLNKMIDQRRKTPISLMVTGHDILFFWLARMVMLSIHLTGNLPFREVLLHCLVCDAHGKKMSKSIGNVIEPDDVIHGVDKSEMKNRLESSFKEGKMTKENYHKALAFQRSQFPKGIPECGVDALRLTLCSANIQGASMNFDVNACFANRTFCNKIYQAMNYFIKISNEYRMKTGQYDLEDTKSNKKNLNCFDMWILSRLADVIQCADSNLTAYRLDLAADAIRLFVMNEFCNFYLEATKPILQNCSPLQYKTVISVFFNCMETSLRLLSPFMPFTTEYLYINALPSLSGYRKLESLTVAEFPKAADWNKFCNFELEAKFKKILNFLTTVRRAKDVFSLKSEKPNVLIKCPDDVAELMLGKKKNVFEWMGGIGDLSRIENLEVANVIQQVVDDDITAFVEHKHNKKTLQTLFGPKISKENELKQKLDELVKSTTAPDWENLFPSAKLKVTRTIHTLNSEINKIQDFKWVIENCNR